MPEIDYAYISENIANISRIQIRIYENKSCTGYYSATAFDPDPALPYLDRLLDAPVSIRRHPPRAPYYGHRPCLPVSADPLKRQRAHVSSGNR